MTCIAKLHSYGWSLTSLRLLNDYLSNRKPQIKIKNVFSEWENIKTGVPQGSILDPPLLNILLYQPNYRLCDQITGGTIYPTVKLV